MKKILVFLATGFEEGETATIIDVLRRAKFHCQSVSLNDELVTGAHDIVFQADLIMGIDIKPLLDYDMIVLPGGWTGVDNLENDKRVIEIVQHYSRDSEKYVAAMCAAPSVLAKAGVTSGKTLTSYPGPKLEPLLSDSNYITDAVAFDDKLITSRGPATALPFVFAIVDILGGDSSTIKERFLYNLLKEYPDGLNERMDKL